MRFALLIAAGLTSGCAALPPLFAPEPTDVPDSFVILAPQDRQAIGRGLCARLRTGFDRACDVVASEGLRLDLERTAATPGFIAFAAPESLADRDAVQPVRAVLNQPFMLFARRALALKTDDDLAALKIGATPATLSDFESVMTAQGRSDSDFAALYEVSESDIQDFADFCAPETADDLPFDVLAATATHPDAAIRALADDKDCRLRPIPLRGETVGDVVARRDDRLAVFVADATLDAYRYRGDAYPTFAEIADLAVSARLSATATARIVDVLGPSPNRTID